MRETDVKLSVRILKLRHYDDIYLGCRVRAFYLTKKVTFSGRFCHNKWGENARDEDDAVCKVQASVIIKVQKLLAVFFIVIVNIFDVHWGLSRVPYWMSTPLKLSQNRMRRVVCSSSWHPDCRNPMKIVAWSRDGCSHVWIFFKMLGGKKGKGTSIFSQILELEMVKWSFQ